MLVLREFLFNYFFSNFFKIIYWNDKVIVPGAQGKNINTGQRVLSEKSNNRASMAVATLVCGSLCWVFIPTTKMSAIFGFVTAVLAEDSSLLES
jgi:hypothetical protein